MLLEPFDLFLDPVNNALRLLSILIQMLVLIINQRMDGNIGHAGSMPFSKVLVLNMLLLFCILYILLQTFLLKLVPPTSLTI